MIFVQGRNHTRFLGGLAKRSLNFLFTTKMVGLKSQKASLSLAELNNSSLSKRILQSWPTVVSVCWRLGGGPHVLSIPKLATSYQCSFQFLKTTCNVGVNIELFCSLHWFDPPKKGRRNDQGMACCRHSVRRNGHPALDLWARLRLFPNVPSPIWGGQARVPWLFRQKDGSVFNPRLCSFKGCDLLFFFEIGAWPGAECLLGAQAPNAQLPSFALQLVRALQGMNVSCQSNHRWVNTNTTNGFSSGIHTRCWLHCFLWIPFHVSYNPSSTPSCPTAKYKNGNPVRLTISRTHQATEKAAAKRQGEPGNTKQVHRAPPCGFENPKNRAPPRKKKETTPPPKKKTETIKSATNKMRTGRVTAAAGSPWAAARRPSRHWRLRLQLVPGGLFC